MNIHQTTVAPPVAERPNLTAAKNKLSAAVILAVPPRIVGVADRQDGEAIRDHLMDLARAFDAYVYELGRFASEHAPTCFGQKVLDECFKSPAVDALEGNATFYLETAWDDAEESAADTRAEVRREFERGA